MDSMHRIQGSRDQHSFDSSPELIAVCHALHRLLVPRHPPHALSSLAALLPPSRFLGGLTPSARQEIKSTTSYSLNVFQLRSNFVRSSSGSRDCRSLTWLLQPLQGHLEPIAVSQARDATQ